MWSRSLRKCSQPVFRSLFEGSRSQRRFLAKFNKFSAPRMLGLTFFSFIVESLMLLEFCTPRVLVRPKLLSSTLFMVAFQQLLMESLMMLFEQLVVLFKTDLSDRVLSFRDL